MSGVAIAEPGNGALREGRCHKIRHASHLLQQIDAERVRKRCPHCRRLFDVVGRMMDAA